ncbi:MAG: hypothetical protein K8S21_12230 [Gemmatimonadetes bacterium]|nr:hypothetical protein [Gemmatimonadota bacterium]
MRLAWGGWRTLAVLALGAACAAPRPTPAEPREVTVVGLDYAFQLPAELPAGWVTFRFHNAGKVRHEFNISLLKSDATVQQFIAAANADQPVTPLRDATVGVLFAEPGGDSPSGLTTELLPGRTYVVHCIFRDSEGAPPHHAMGMYAELRVTTAPPVVVAAPRIDTITGMDYAYRAPATLPAGVHHLAFINVGSQRHELTVTLLRAGVTVQQFMDAEMAERDVADLVESDLGLLHSPGRTAPRGLLRVDLLPGREYLLECAFADSDSAPPHFRLGMFGSIRVDAAPAQPRRPTTGG